jgi:hypothetical protein
VLDEGQTDGLEVKLEEESPSREARVGCELPFVVCDAKLLCMQRRGPWCDIGCWNDEVILIRDEFCRHISRSEIFQKRATHYRE